jgi:hypothetical protein
MPIVSSPYALFQHATTSKAIVKAALRKIGAIDAGEKLSASELNGGIEELNRMLDCWNTEKLVVHVLNRTEWTLSAATESVEIGPGADLDTTRPQTIEQGDAWIRQTSDSEQREYVLKVWPQNRWASINYKDQTGKPQVLYYEPSFPLGVIYLWPIPDEQYDLILYTWNLLGQVSNVEQAMALPPGYTDAIVNELAARLAPEYGVSVPPEVVAAAVTAKANIKRANIQEVETRVDDALITPRRWDIRTGEFIDRNW